MKKSMTMGAMAVALLAAVSCSDTETEILPEPGNNGNDQVALGITTNLKVDASTKTATKSIVSGEAITYEKYSDAPGLGILVTNKDGNAWYEPEGTEYTGYHVWYMGDEKGENWISITTKGATYKDAKEVPYYLTEKIGKVYAYYPYDASVKSSVSVSDLEIPVSVKVSGAIDASINNAKKYRNGSTWATNKSASVKLSDSTEKDYLYFADEGGAGRYVNNGRAAGQPAVKPDAEPNNSDQNNPGYKIKLDMKHAMAMVSFRVYDGGQLSTKDVNFTKFVIKNIDTGTSPFKIGTGTMSLVDGSIDESALSAGTLTRTISNYILMREVEKGTTEDEYHFIETGSGSTATMAKSVSKTVSAIVYPIASFGDDEITALITLKEKDGDEVEYPVVLPANDWAAGKNTIYTLSAGRNKLTVTEVSVTDWDDDDNADVIPL